MSKSKAKSLNKHDYKKLLLPIGVALATVYSTNTEMYNDLIAQYIPKQILTAIIPVITYSIALWLKGTSSTKTTEQS